MILATLFSLKTMESLKNGLQPHSGATPLFFMRTVLLASSQTCHSIDADAWCKRALMVCSHCPTKIPMQRPTKMGCIEFIIIFVGVSVGLYVGVSVGQCERTIMVYSHCTGLVQGSNRWYSTMWKYSHWSETGTRSHCFLLCQSFSLYLFRSRFGAVWIYHKANTLAVVWEGILNEPAWLSDPWN